MELTSMRWWPRLQVIFGVSAAVLGPAGQAGEPIRDHERTERPDLAVPSNQERKLPEMNIFNRSKNSGAVNVPVVPFRQTPTLNSKEFEELLKKQKNWLWETPKSWDKDQEKSLANAGLKLDGGKERKTDLERFIDEDSDENDKNRTNSTRASDHPLDLKSDSSGTFLDWSNGKFAGFSNEDPLKQKDLDPDHIFRAEWDPANSTGRDQFNLHDLDQQFRAAVVTDRIEDPRLRQQARTQEQERSRAMEDLLKLRLPSLAKSMDPINSQTDITQKEMNPVTAKSFDENFSKMGPPGMRAFDSARENGPNRSSLLDSINAKVMSGSSLAPAVILPPSQIAPSKPAMFEIPRRRF